VSSPLWNFRPDINSVWNLLSCLCGMLSLSLSLTRDRVFSWVDVTDGQSAYSSWCRAPLWGPWPDFFFCRTLKFEVTLRPTVNQLACLGIEHTCGTCDQILLPVRVLLSEICGLVSVGRLLWWEDGSAICNVTTQWSESRKTRNHILLSHLRLPQSGGPSSHLPRIGWTQQQLYKHLTPGWVQEM
jgi:hypothetical protein